MYQSPSTICTVDWRSDAPVCITRLAMRPAKSFWKNARLCRTTWLCISQRRRLLSPGTSAWLISRLSSQFSSGRTSSTTAAIHSRSAACTRKNAGPAASIMSTMRPR